MSMLILNEVREAVAEHFDRLLAAELDLPNARNVVPSSSETYGLHLGFKILKKIRI